MPGKEQLNLNFRNRIPGKRSEIPDLPEAESAPEPKPAKEEGNAAEEPRREGDKESGK
jgi:hypothetical protein